AAGTSLLGPLVFAPNGSALATASGNVIRLWNPTKGMEAGALKAHAKPVSALAFSADGRLLASAGQDGLVVVWDAASVKQIVSLYSSDGSEVLSLTFLGDGSSLVCGTARHEISVLWDPKTGKQRIAFAGTRYAGVRHLASTKDGKLLASSSDFANVQL